MLDENVLRGSKLRISVRRLRGQRDNDCNIDVDEAIVRKQAEALRLSVEEAREKGLLSLENPRNLPVEEAAWLSLRQTYMSLAAELAVLDEALALWEASKTSNLFQSALQL